MKKTSQCYRSLCMAIISAFCAYSLSYGAEWQIEAQTPNGQRFTDQITASSEAEARTMAEYSYSLGADFKGSRIISIRKLQNSSEAAIAPKGKTAGTPAKPAWNDPVWQKYRDAADKRLQNMDDMRRVTAPTRRQELEQDAQDRYNIPTFSQPASPDVAPDSISADASSEAATAGMFDSAIDSLNRYFNAVDVANESRQLAEEGLKPDPIAATHTASESLEETYQKVPNILDRLSNLPREWVHGEEQSTRALEQNADDLSDTVEQGGEETSAEVFGVGGVIKAKNRLYNDEPNELGQH